MSGFRSRVMDALKLRGFIIKTKLKIKDFINIHIYG